MLPLHSNVQKVRGNVQDATTRPFLVRDSEQKIMNSFIQFSCQTRRLFLVVSNHKIHQRWSDKWTFEHTAAANMDGNHCWKNPIQGVFVRWVQRPVSHQWPIETPENGGHADAAITWLFIAASACPSFWTSFIYTTVISASSISDCFSRATFKLLEGGFQLHLVGGWRSGQGRTIKIRCRSECKGVGSRNFDEKLISIT